MSAGIAWAAVIIAGFLLMHVVMSLVFRPRPRCICLFEDWPPAVGIETGDDGSEYVVYPRCPVHGHQARTRIHEETASSQLAA